MNFRTREEHKAIVVQYPYYRGRWLYVKAAIDLLRTKNFKSVLELGPGPAGFSIIHNADTMWLKELAIRPTYQHDATQLPWPITDRQYDLLIALQVFEHLKGQQAVVFQELQRVAKMALLSLPYKWGKPGHSHHVTEEMIEKWTDGLEPKERMMLSSCSSCRVSKNYLLLFYEF